MNKAMWKTTLREIRQSLGRYMAILAIIALGVSLFAGLKLTKPFMLEMADRYLTEKNFYDFRLMSTYGYEADEVEYLASQPEVEAVQGAYAYDVLYEYGEENATYVMKVHSLTEGINEPEVIFGRLPQNADECVVDYRLYGEEALGKTVRISEENEEDTLDFFAVTEFTIVGVVNSSYYIQFERGNTSLGSGKVNGFMYVTPEAVDSKIYTEIFIKLNKDFPLYSDEYNDYIEQKGPQWEGYAETAAQARYERVLAEANEELADARKEFEEEKSDAEAELADAEAELADAAQELADAQQKLEDGKQEIADGYKEIAEKEKELADAEVTLAENEQTLIEKEQELAEGIEEWNENNWIVEDAKSELYDQKEALDAQEAELLAQEEELLAQEAQFEAMLQIPGMSPGEETIASTRAQFEEGKARIAAGKEQISGYQEQLEEGLDELHDADLELAEGRREIEDGKKQIADAKQEIADAKIEIADGKNKLADAKKDLAEAEEELADAEKELADGEAEYQDALQEYEEGVAEFQEEIADAEAEIADAEKDIEELEEPESYVLGRDTNVGYVCLESDSNIVSDVADVFPVFFFLVAALVCTTTMNRMIEEQRTQIGVLKALGYDNMAIMGKYMIYSGSAAFLGCILGYFFGTIVYPKTIWAAYTSMYSMPSLVYYIDWKIMVISLVASLVCSMGVTWYSCKVELSEVPALLLRPKAPKAGKRIFLEYIPFLWKNLKFLQKVSIRNVLRYKKRFFMMVIGISGCTALLVAGFGMLDSIKGVVGLQYSEIQLYDVSVTFSEQPDEEVMQEYDSIIKGKADNSDFFMETSLDLNYEEFTKSISVVVPKDIETFEKYIDLHTPQQEKIDFPNVGEAVITHKLAEELNIRTGDVVSLTDEEHNSFEVVISGINENFVDKFIFLHPDTCTSKWKEPEYKTAYINISKADEDIHSLSAELMKMDEVANVTVSMDVEERFESMMSSMNYIVFVIILCAAALAFIVLYNLTNINITERVREIATIKVLGFYKNETATYVFRENLILTAIGAFIGLLLGKFFHAFVMSCIKVDMVAFDVRVEAPSYLYSFAMTFLFAWFVNRFMIGKIEKISMTESLKSVD